MEAELIYCRRRAEEETAAAACAPDDRVRSIHLELGRRYGERASTIEAERRRSQLYVVNADVPA